jgi:hypothetical protein
MGRRVAAGDGARAMSRFAKSFLDFLDNRTIIRRAVLLFVLWMTYIITRDAWAFARFAVENKFDATAIGLIIGAVTLPFTGVVKFAFEMYSAARNNPPVAP